MSEVIDALHGILQHLQSFMEPEECHGHLSGYLCAGGKASDWPARAFAEADKADLLVQEDLEKMLNLADETQNQLNDPMMGFQLLLLGDEVDLNARGQSLGRWCQGFVLGMSELGMMSPDNLPENSAEVLQDIMEFSRLEAYESGEEDSSMEEEGAYEELVEYVRTGVLLVHEELNPSRRETPIDLSGQDITYH